jgi:hypothetical protein
MQTKSGRSITWNNGKIEEEVQLLTMKPDSEQPTFFLILGTEEKASNKTIYLL